MLTGSMEPHLQAPIALGTIANLEQEMSAALAPAHQEAVAAVRQAPVKYVDETGWKQAGRKRWLWAAATNTVVVFLIDVFRNVTALRKLLGPTLSGILCSDRWSAYDHVELLKRQVCWAHLKRNWEKMLDRGGKAKIVAESCLSVQSACSTCGICFAVAVAVAPSWMMAWRRCCCTFWRFCRGACVVGIARPSASARVCWGFTRRCGRSWSWKASNRPTTTSSARSVGPYCGVAVRLAARAQPAAALWSAF